MTLTPKQKNLIISLMLGNEIKFDFDSGTHWLTNSGETVRKQTLVALRRKRLISGYRLTDEGRRVGNTIFDVFKIAKYFIYLSNENNLVITNKKLQKLVYYAQAWSLALRNKNLFNENIEAWIHGPVIRTLFDYYKRFHFSSIEEQISPTIEKLFSPEEKQLLDNIWSVYGKFDATYLEILVHSEKPWQEARARHNQVISSESMIEFYKSRLEQVQGNIST